MPYSMSRRQFVQAAGVGVAGAAALAAGRPLGAENLTGRIKKAVKFGMIGGDMPVTDKFKMLQDIGYDGVEVGYRDDVDPAAIVAARDATGLPVHGVVLGSVDGINDAIDRAKLFGASSVLLVAGRVSDTMPYAQNYEETQAAIRKSIAYADQHEILLLVENVWNYFLLSPLEMRQYIDELNSPWVQVYFDVGNTARFGWPEHWIPVLGDRIRKLDIKPYSRKKQMEEGPWKGFDVLLGDGDIDWPAVRKELAAIGYEGWATAEVPGGDRDYLVDLSKRMDGVLGLA